VPEHVRRLVPSDLHRVGLVHAARAKARRGRVPSVVEDVGTGLAADRKTRRLARRAPRLLEVEARDFLTEMPKLLGEWNEAGRLADATPRIALAPQVAKLRAIKRRAEQLSTHACATNLQATFVRRKPICFGTWLLRSLRAPDGHPRRRLGCNTSSRGQSNRGWRDGGSRRRSVGEWALQSRYTTGEKLSADAGFRRPSVR